MKRIVSLATLVVAVLTVACATTPKTPVVDAPQMRVVAGDGSAGFADGYEAKFHKPIRLAPFDEDSVVVADIYNHAIRLVYADGRVVTLLGDPSREGHRDGFSFETALSSPHGVAVSPNGEIAVAEASNHTIRILQKAVINHGNELLYSIGTMAGIPGESGLRDGESEQSLFSSPHAVLWMSDSELLVADIGNACLRLVTWAVDGAVTTVVGKEAKLVYPMDLALAPDGSVVIADAGTNELKRWRPGEAVETIALDAELATPHGVSVAPDGTIYVADMMSHRVLAVDTDGHVTVVCGTGEAGSDVHELNRPAAVLVHNDMLWIADLDNHQIKVLPLD